MNAVNLAKIFLLKFRITWNEMKLKMSSLTGKVRTNKSSLPLNLKTDWDSELS